MMRLVLLGTLVTQSGSQVLFSHSTFTSGSSMLSDFHPQHLWGAMDVVSDPTGGSGNVLRVHYAAGSHSHTTDRDRGGQFYSSTASPHTSLLLSYDVYFASNFEWVQGGKLPGLWGGATSNCSGGRHSDDCFTTRFMWRDGAKGEVYAYITKNQEAGFCNRSDVFCNFDFGNSLGTGKWHFKKGAWQNIAQFVHLNTPGQHDGYITVFLDGHEVYRINNIALRSKGSVHIDGMMFSTFFGGHDDTWASPHSTYTYFKNFIISTGSSPPVGR